MYKNLNCDLLGISGRQSEIIELALTYGFRGIDIDISDMVKRSQRTSFEAATRFLTSSKLKIGGFETPVELDSDDETFAAQSALLNAVAEVAGRTGARLAIVNIPSQTDRLPYPEYFEVIRQRVDSIVEIFAKEEVQVALAFCPANEGESKQFKFVQDVEGFLALAKSCKAAGIVLDTWEWYRGNGTLEQLEQFGLERVLAVRIADCAEGVTGEAATSEDCLLPNSTGVIDNVSYLSKLSEAGRKLPVSARGRSAKPAGTRDAFVDKTQDSLDKTFEAAGIPTTTRKPEMFVQEHSYASQASE